MALSMAEKFDTYWTDFHGIMVVATILDPIFKMKVIECYFPKIYGDQTSDEIQKIHDLLLRMFREYEGKLKVGQTSGASSSGDPINVSLEIYLEEPVIPRVDNFDILRWWYANESRYPTLHCIARDILAILVSTVAFESSFCTGGRFVGPHRSRLHPKTIEALMCAQDWLWTEFNASALERKFEASTFDDDYDDGDCQGK
ncbi:hypothetical protein Ddye_015907 [Dipteronia dyeriana]|uniref:HAT C-terminal dimerisation domain-containing protein n=1 Tax=Dipteronia dyeriana TaxID=168575 RepID=A0AAD9U6G1_9ROSI|nr:hypothetical protein Ddye_015907 [Dipteronia dyeriana]